MERTGRWSWRTERGENMKKNSISDYVLNKGIEYGDFITHPPYDSWVLVRVAFRNDEVVYGVDSVDFECQFKGWKALYEEVIDLFGTFCRECKCEYKVTDVYIYKCAITQERLESDNA